MIKKFENFKSEPEVEIKYNFSGNKSEEIWKLNNKFHREDGPAYQSWYDNGKKHNNIWYLNGVCYRDDGPAIEYWYDNGQKWYKYWFKVNRSTVVYSDYHREDGPARQEWSYNGQKYYEGWYLNDIDYSREEWVNKLKKIGSPHYKEQRMLLDMEKYNL